MGDKSKLDKYMYIFEDMYNYALKTSILETLETLKGKTEVIAFLPDKLNESIIRTKKEREKAKEIIHFLSALAI